MVGRFLGDELENIRKEANVAQFKILFRNLPTGTEKNHE
jgi:hypothetical protein